MYIPESQSLTDLAEEYIYWIKGYHVIQVKTGYEVYKEGLTHSTRCAQIGWPDSDYGKQKAIEECVRRYNQDKNN